MTAAPSRAPVDAALEIGKRRSFASALDWPGWCRSGRDESAAIEALASYAPRYLDALALVGIVGPAGLGEELAVVERLEGDATTDFGAPGAIAGHDSLPCGEEVIDHLLTCLDGCWAALEVAAADAPPELRKGPRGGGRDRDAIVTHVLEAEASYARKLGARLRAPALEDATGRLEFHSAIALALRRAEATPASWPPRYAARRIGWHALDHAWEIEDRSRG